MDLTFSIAIWKRLKALSKEKSLSTMPLVYNFLDYVNPISHYVYGIKSLTVIVVVRPGPVKVYDVPGFAGVLDPGSTTL